MDTNGTPASPATALASKVFPVPGGPFNKAPFGILAPIEVYLSGSFRKSTSSSSSYLASATPATEPKLISVLGWMSTLAFDLYMPRNPFSIA